MARFTNFRVIAATCCCILIGADSASGQITDAPPPEQGSHYIWNGPDGQAAFFGSPHNWLVEGRIPNAPPGKNDTIVFFPPDVGVKSAVVDLSSPNVPDFAAVVGGRMIRGGEVVLRNGVLHVAGDGIVGDKSTTVGPTYFVGDEGLPAVVRHDGNVALFGGETVVSGDGGGYEMDGSLSLGFGEHPDNSDASEPLWPPYPWFVVRDGAAGRVGGNVLMDRGRLMAVDGGTMAVEGDLLMLPPTHGAFPPNMILGADAQMRASKILVADGLIQVGTHTDIAGNPNPANIQAKTVELSGPALLTGESTIGTEQLVNGGRIAPGSPGTLGILGISGIDVDIPTEPVPGEADSYDSGSDGFYTQTADGLLEIDLDPGHPKQPGSAASDRLEIAGHAELDGKLVIRVNNSKFRPRPGTEFEVMTFASRSGDLEIVDETGLKGLRFEKVFGKTTLTLRVVQGKGELPLPQP